MIKSLKTYKITNIKDFTQIYYKLNADARIKFDILRNKQFSNLKTLKLAVEDILEADSKNWGVLEIPTHNYVYDGYILIQEV